MKIRLRSRKISGGRETLYLDYYDHGKRRLEYLELYLTGDRHQDRETWKLAEQIEAKKKLEYACDEHGFVMLAKQKADFIEYCKRLGENKRSPNTRLVWKNAVEHLKTYCGGWVPFAKVNHAFLEGFRDYLLRQVSVNSAGVYLARIKTACHRAVRDAIFTKSPAADVNIRKQETRREFLTLDELQKLASTPCGNEAVRDAFLFSAFSGLRYSDVRALTWEKVKESNGGLALQFVQAKTGDFEILPLSKQAALILQQQKTAEASPRIAGRVADGMVFKLPGQQTIDKEIKRWVKRAEIQKRISFHCARHTFATLGLTQGVDLYVMSKLLGHRSVATTQIYAKVVDQRKRQAVEMFPSLEFKSGGVR